MEAVGKLLHIALTLFELGLLAYALCSWVAHSAARTLRARLQPIYEPFLIPIRRAVPSLRTQAGYVDLSPLILFVAVWVIRGLLRALLVDI